MMRYNESILSSTENPSLNTECPKSSETEKPPYLFHASSNRNVKEFEPRAESIRHPDEGPAVFAAETPEEVSVFLVPSNDSWSQKSAWRDEQGNRTSVSIYADRDRFEKNDRGGSIYQLPSDTFNLDEKFSGSSKEWTSKEPVKPHEKKDYSFGLQAMMDFGVRVYFVTKEQLLKIQQSEDHGYNFLQTLESENEKLGETFQQPPHLST